MGFIFCGKHPLLLTSIHVSDPGPMGPLVSYPNPMHTEPQLSSFHTHRLLNLSPRGRGTLIFSCIHVGPDHFWGVNNFDFQYFWDFRNMNTVMRGYGEGTKCEYSLRIAKISNILFLVCLMFLIFFGASSRC